MGSHPQELGRAMRPRCRRWCNSSRSAERLLVFYLLSLHSYFRMVYASARPIPHGFSSLDRVNDWTGTTPDGLRSNDTVSWNESSEKSTFAGPTAKSHSKKPPAPVIVVIVIVGVLLSMAATKLYLICKRNCTVSPPLPEKETEGGVDPGTREAATPSFATAIDTSLKSSPGSVPQQANGSHPSLDHQRSRRWKLSIFSSCREGATESDAKSAPNGTSPRDMLTKTVSFRRSDVKRATRNFAKKIGAGGFGPVYYGRLPGSGLEVAVKVHANNSRQVPEFTTEVEILSRAKHPNLVSLVGHCEERSRCMLVYEYLPGGTLKDRLYGRRSNPPLDWKARLKIAVQAAKGLEYLHKECVPSIIHRDVKSNNILLTKSGDAKLIDFGLCKSLEEMALKCSVQGTSGYLDPEYYKSMRLTHKSDVYSFGIVLLELISARGPAETTLPHKEEWMLADWVRNNLVEGKLEAIVDKALDSNVNKQSMWWVAELAMTCVEPQSIYRPTISEVVLELEAIRADDAHRPRIGQTTPNGTPHSCGTELPHSPTASSLAEQSRSSSIPRSSPGDTPESSRPAPSPAYQRQGSITLGTPGDSPGPFRPAPSLAHQRQDSNINLSTPSNTLDSFGTAPSLDPHSQTFVQT